MFAGDSAGFEVKVVASDNYVKADSGLIYRDFDVGQGDCPKDGQQVRYPHPRSNHKTGLELLMILLWCLFDR